MVAASDPMSFQAIQPPDIYTFKPNAGTRPVDTFYDLEAQSQESLDKGEDYGDVELDALGSLSEAPAESVIPTRNRDS